MTYHVLVLTSTYLSRYLNDLLKNYDKNIRFKIVEYDSFSQLTEIYLANEKWADGVLTTGAVIKRVLQLSLNRPLKPMVALGTDNESFYRIPLSLIIENRNLNPERIVFDVFMEMMPSASVLNLIETKSIQEIFVAFSYWLQNATLEDLYNVEIRTLEKIKSLWNEGKIDLVICRYGSLFKHLEELSIPCVFATSTNEYVIEILQSLLSAIKVKKISDHAPAVVAISPSDTGTFNERAENKIEEILEKYAKENDLSVVIQKKKDIVYLFTERSVVAFLTDQLRGCRLSAFLSEDVGQPLTVCYGVGHTISNAIKNAHSALRTSGFSMHSYFVDEDMNTIGPLGVSEPISVDDSITPTMRNVASKAGLSITTVQRLFRLTTLLDRKEITNDELADAFRISSRGANRILKKLEACGLASISMERNPHLKGRPAKIYHMNWNE